VRTFGEEGADFAALPSSNLGETSTQTADAQTRSKQSNTLGTPQKVRAGEPALRGLDEILWFSRKRTVGLVQLAEGC
jgi:hypothetical protein